VLRKGVSSPISSGIFQRGVMPEPANPYIPRFWVIQSLRCLFYYCIRCIKKN
jgi:hypothetical protein